MRTRATQPMTRGPDPTSHTAGMLVPECKKGEPPPAVVRLFIFAETNGLVPNARARAHGSSSLGAGSWVQRSQNAACDSTALPQGHRRGQKVNF
jgi:hypothetical protein